jgi:hypothetical protein
MNWKISLLYSKRAVVLLAVVTWISPRFIFSANTPFTNDASTLLTAMSSVQYVPRKMRRLGQFGGDRSNPRLSTISSRMSYNGAKIGLALLVSSLVGAL